MATPLNTANRSFDALYRDSARDPYAYARTLLGDDDAAADRCSRIRPDPA